MNMENKDLKKFIYRWFDMKYQTYDKLVYEDNIYWYFKGNEYSEVVIDKYDHSVSFSETFSDDFYEIFLSDINLFGGIIVDWFEDNYNMKSIKIHFHDLFNPYVLKIPN